MKSLMIAISLFLAIGYFVALPNVQASSPLEMSAVPTPKPTPTKNERRYIRGPRGGCYYINKNGNKTYVDRSLCD